MVRILVSALELSNWILFVVQAPGSIDRFSIGVAASFYVSVNPPGNQRWRIDALCVFETSPFGCFRGRG